MFIYQVNQHELNFCPARCCCSSRLLVVDCSLSVTEKSVRVSVRESRRLQDFKCASNFNKTIKIWSGKKNEKENKISESNKRTKKKKKILAQ